jgi:galactokinase
MGDAYLLPDRRVKRMISAHAPGRVNLIGDHTDYSGGLVCPMAIDLGTTVELSPGGDTVELTSDAVEGRAVVTIGGTARPTGWAAYIAGVVAMLKPSQGGTGTVTTTLPVGAGLSSSAALEVATGLALGADPADPERLALVCQQAEQVATGVPCGIMDQLVCAAGVAGHAIVIDCTTLVREPVAIPDGVAVVVVHSGQQRALAGSAYAERREQVEAAAALLGRPLPDVAPPEVEGIPDAVLRRRARHVVRENARVRAFAAALAGHDPETAGALMNESHASLRDDFEVSTPALDALAARLRRAPGVWGARLTGAGFGGCVVALCEEGSPLALEERHWVVHPSSGASVSEA